MLGAVTAGNGSSSPSTAGINVASGAKLITNNYNLTVKRSVSVVSNGGTIDLGNTYTFSPYTGYNPSFSTGSTVISSNTTGIDGNINLPASNVSTIGWFAASGINYQFTAANSNSKLFCTIVANTSSAAAGSGTTIQVSSINNAFIGQSIYNANTLVGSITAVTSGTNILTSSASLASIATGKNINLRNPPAVGTTSTSAQASTGAQTFNVASATGIVAGQCIYDNAGIFYGTVTSISSNTIKAALAVVIPNNTYFNFRHPLGANFVVSTTTTSTYTQGSSTTFTVTSPTSIAAGQYIVCNGLVVGTVTSISSSTVTATLSTTISSGSTVAFYTTASSLSVGTLIIGANNTLNTPITLTGALTLSGQLNSNGNNITAGSISGGSSSNYIYGNGLVTINGVSASVTTFPVGISSSEYDPITLTSTTNTPNITVGLQNTVMHAPVNSTNIVNLQWSVLSSVASNSIIKFQYNTIDVSGTLASPIMGVYTSSYAESTLGAISGSNPYTLTQSASAALAMGAAYLYGIGNPNSFVSASSPGAPTIGTAVVNGTGSAKIPFTAPASNGGSTITTYTATSSPGNITGTLSQASSGTITVTGLSNGTSYTFTVTATNASGTSAASSVSNAVTPGVFTYNSGNVDLKASWVDAAGVNPSDFTTAGQTFTITGATSVTSWTSNATWTVSAVTVGDGTNAATLSITVGSSISGTVNVQLASTLKVESTTNPPFTAGTFTSNPTYGAALVYDGSGTQYLPAGTYTGGVKVSGSTNTVVLNGNITVGAGTSGSPSGSNLNILTGNTLSLNGNNVTILNTSSLPSGATINFGTGTIKQGSYAITFLSGSNIITSNTNGLDGSLDYSASTGGNGSSTWFASGVNYTFNAATTTPFSTEIASAKVSGVTGSGSSTSITVTTAANIANVQIGQSIFIGTGQTIVGTVTGVNTGTGVVNANITGTAPVANNYINFRNNAASTTVANVTAGTVTLGAAISLNANLTASTSIALGNYNLTLGGLNASITNSTSPISYGTGYVVEGSTGTLGIKAVANTSITFPVGSASGDYNPIIFNPSALTTITVGAQQGFTNTLATGAANYVNLQWSVKSSAVVTSTINFQYNSSSPNDVTGTLSTSDLYLGNYSGAYSETDITTGATQVGATSVYTITTPSVSFTAGNTYLYGIGNQYSFVANTAPGAPTVGTVVVNGSGSAKIPFTQPASNGGIAITKYTATSSPSGITGTLSQAGSGTITVTGLTNGTSYTFTVTAYNGSTGTASSVSNAVTPGIFTYNTGNVDLTASWQDAAGVSPSDFTTTGQIFTITGAGTVSSWTSNATWTVSGTGPYTVTQAGASDLASTTAYLYGIGNQNSFSAGSPGYYYYSSGNLDNLNS